MESGRRHRFSVGSIRRETERSHNIRHVFDRQCDHTPPLKRQFTSARRVYADRLARRGYNLTLVARNETRLKSLSARSMSETGQSVNVSRADLNDRADLSTVEATLWDEPSMSCDIRLVPRPAPGGNDVAGSAYATRPNCRRFDCHGTPVERGPHVNARNRFAREILRCKNHQIRPAPSRS